MNKILTLLLGLSFSLSAQLPPNSKLFDQQGNEIALEQMINEIAEAQVVLFGELHGVEQCHALEKTIAEMLYAKVNDKLILGGEMWERDQQLIVDEYVQGHINSKQFIADARLWPSFAVDYQPFIDIARENKLPFIATNIPRRYASMVYQNGVESLESLSKDARKLYLPKLPFTFDAALPIYADIADQANGHGGENLPAAQAIKDATMAMFIANNMKKKNLFFHINGEYHSKEFQGIYNYLRQSNKKWDIRSISCVMQHDIKKLSDDNIARANYILVVQKPSAPKEEIRKEE